MSDLGTYMRRTHLQNFLEHSSQAHGEGVLKLLGIPMRLGPLYQAFLYRDLGSDW